MIFGISVLYLNCGTWLKGRIEFSTLCHIEVESERFSSILSFSTEVPSTICWSVVHLVAAKASLVEHTLCIRASLAATKMIQLLCVEQNLVLPEHVWPASVPFSNQSARILGLALTNHPELFETGTSGLSWDTVHSHILTRSPSSEYKSTKRSTKVYKSPEFIGRARVTILKEITSGGIHQHLVVARAVHHIFASSTWKIWFTLLQFVVI